MRTTGTPVRPPRPTLVVQVFLVLAGVSLLPMAALHLVTALLGGGVSLGDDPADEGSGLLALGFAALFAGLSAAHVGVAVAVRRGALWASVLALCLSVAAACGAVAELAGLTDGARGVRPGTVVFLMASLAMTGCLLSPSHRRHVAARRAARGTVVLSGPAA